MTRSPWWWLTAAVMVLWTASPAISQPQTNLLNKGCSQYNATNRANFLFNRDETFADLKRQLSHGGRHFATAQHARSSDAVYVMAQCRNYLSTADCVACFDAAVTQIRNCSSANGARVIFEGCFLRYESNTFYDQSTLPGNTNLCGNQTASQPTAFAAAVRGLLTDLEAVTPRIKGFFVATTREVSDVNLTVYAVAQCAETVSQSGCQDCLTVAYGNIQNCPPNTDGSAIDAGCFLRYSAKPFFADNQTTNISPFLSRGGSSKKKAIIGGVVGGVSFILLILAIILLYQLSTKPKAQRRGDILGATELQGPACYNYRDLKSATKNFSEETKLGEGGFGYVYKGTLKNGIIVAVKKLDISSSRAKSDFESEVRLISNVHHRNVIRLLGCSNKGPELLLVYEYMENGSLDKFLYGEKKSTLNWKQRYDIIFGMARGLAYLHEHFHVCIIHRDIKSSNILLDNDFQPKIADFGLARLLPEDQSHVSTRVAGTLGYTAPEYALSGQLSEKVDTYSFGVVVLEIISGRRSSEVKIETSDTEFLLEQAWKLYENKQHMALIDKNLDPNEYSAEEAKKVVELALVCTQSPASLRPMMSEVVVLLSEGSVEQKPASRPTFIGDGKRIRVDTSSTTSVSSASNATASFTEFTGR